MATAKHGAEQTWKIESVRQTRLNTSNEITNLPPGIAHRFRRMAEGFILDPQETTPSQERENNTQPNDENSIHDLVHEWDSISTIAQNKIKEEKAAKDLARRTSFKAKRSNVPHNQISSLTITRSRTTKKIRS